VAVPLRSVNDFPDRVLAHAGADSFWNEFRFNRLKCRASLTP
jgi:hypothetical protein